MRFYSNLKHLRSVRESKMTTMKKQSLVLLACMLLHLFSCEEEIIVTDFAFEEATIIDRDLSRWACGGSWVVAQAQDTFVVQSFPDAEIMASLEADMPGENLPIDVYIVVSHEPTSSCAVNFPDRVKELRAVQLREE